jgi:hypothetical protein
MKMIFVLEVMVNIYNLSDLLNPPSYIREYLHVLFINNKHKQVFI